MICGLCKCVSQNIIDAHRVVQTVQLNCLCLNRFVFFVDWILMSQFSPNHYDVYSRVLNHCVLWCTFDCDISALPTVSSVQSQPDTRNNLIPKCVDPKWKYFPSLCHISNESDLISIFSAICFYLWPLCWWRRWRQPLWLHSQQQKKNKKDS